MQLSSTKHRALHYPPGGLREDLRLLEVDEDMLAQIVDGDGVVIKGGEHEELVMCTRDRTFGLKYVETTNTLLMFPPDAAGDDDFAAMPSPSPLGLKGSSQVASTPRDTGLQTQMAKAARAAGAPPLVALATAAAHIEVAPIAPRLGRLRPLLLEAPYGEADEAAEQQRRRGGGGGGAAAPAAGGRTYSFAELAERVRASDAELAAALAGMGAVELGGAWRLVDEAYMGGLLELALVTADEHGWPYDCIPLDGMVSSLEPEGFNPAIIEHCLAVHGSRRDSPAAAGPGPGSEAMDVDGGGGGEGASAGRAYALDEARVCVHFARKLMAGRAWQLDELLEAWAAAVPAPFAPARAMLRGEAVPEAPLAPAAGAGARARAGASGPDAWPLDARLMPLRASSLPIEPAERFPALFGLRARWPMGELRPYLDGMQVGPGQTASALLLKYTRSSQASADAEVVLSLRAG